MGDMALLDSRPALRWFAPAALVLVVGGSSLVATNATADPKLPTVSAEQLLVDLQAPKVDGLSGTVRQEADLGLPTPPTSGHGESTGFRSLLSGVHELRVWYAVPGKSRVAVTGAYGETDLITNGTDLWTWSSRTKAVTHATVPDHEDLAAPAGADVPKTPQEAAAKVLAAVDPSTTVSVDSAVDVAGRAAYELVLRPRDTRSLLTEARIAVDGETRSPLRVQIFGRDQRTVLDVGYTAVTFTRPEDSTFEFTPPPGSVVTEKTVPDHAASRGERDETQDQPEAVTTVGTGWTAVAVRKAPEGVAAPGEELQGMLDQLPTESGTWGSGRVLRGNAFSAVLTDDGRMAVGAVPPELLYQALER